MRITFFIGGLGSGGAEHVVVDLANYLSENNEVTIITWSNGTPHYNLLEQVQYYPLRKYNGKSWLKKHIKSFNALKTYVEKQRVDCYVVFLGISTYLLLSLKKKLSCPVIFSVRTYPPKEYEGIIRSILSRHLLRYADGVVYQTRDQDAFFPYLKKLEKIVIPNAVKSFPKVEENRSFHSPNRKRILAVGRLSPEKNYPLMIKVMAKILKDFPEYRLDIYGDGPERKSLEKMIVELNMENQIHLQGVSYDIPTQLRTAEIFLLLSEYEGISNALLEAMAAGLAVVVTDCLGGGNRMLIENRKNGILVPRGNAQQLEISIRELLINSVLRREIASNAQYVSIEYSPEKIYHEWEQFINKVIRKKD